MEQIDLEIHNPSSVVADFDRIAGELMNHHVIVAGENRYRLTVIEFYYHDHQKHDK